MGENAKRSPLAFNGDPLAMTSRTDEPTVHGHLLTGIDGQIADARFRNLRVSVVLQNCQDVDVLNEKPAAGEDPTVAIAFGARLGDPFEVGGILFCIVQELRSASSRKSFPSDSGRNGSCLPSTGKM